MPRTWLVLGDKKGDNGQVYTVADALGWDYELKNIRVLEPYVFGKHKVAPTLYHIDREKSDELVPPWPDLIITVGRRPANVALWIREQSGRRTKIVLVGKPSGLMDEFDLNLVTNSEVLAVNQDPLGRSAVADRDDPLSSGRSLDNPVDDESGVNADFQDQIDAFDEAGADCLYVPLPKTMDDLKRVIAATSREASST